jgi:hypothetical protein
MTSISENTDAMVLNIYPNPSGNMLNINFKSEHTRLMLLMYDLQGKLVKKEFVGHNGSVDLSHLSSGSYYLTLMNHQGKRLSSQIVVKE